MYRDDFYYYFPFTRMYNTYIYMYTPVIVSTLHHLALVLYRRAGTDRNFTDLNAAAAADVRDQWATRP